MIEFESKVRGKKVRIPSSVEGREALEGRKVKVSMTEAEE